MNSQKLQLFGYASGIGGPNKGTADGPEHLKNSPFFSELNIPYEWQQIVKPAENFSDKLTEIITISDNLGRAIQHTVSQKNFFVNFGGDHSSAIGTWSGASVVGSLGLIWIDAHMDSHVPETSPSGNIHGMPLACLLGHGKPGLVNLLNRAPKLKPENICLIGVRSFEAGEADLLKKLNVRIFFMDEVKKRGLKNIMQEAIQIATHNTDAFGVTIDVDSVDPKDAPGTGVAEPDGIPGKTLCEALTLLAHHPQLIGLEIAEFDPHRDKNYLTEKLIVDMIKAIVIG